MDAVPKGKTGRCQCCTNASQHNEKQKTTVRECVCVYMLDRPRRKGQVFGSACVHNWRDYRRFFFFLLFEMGVNSRVCPAGSVCEMSGQRSQSSPLLSKIEKNTFGESECAKNIFIN